MLHEGQRLVKPEDIQKQIPWDELQAVVVIGIPKANDKKDAVWMSTVTVQELGYVTSALNAFTTVRIHDCLEEK